LESNSNTLIIDSYQNEIVRYQDDLKDFENQINNKEETISYYENEINYEKEQIQIINNRIAINTEKLSSISVWASNTETRLNSSIAEDETLKEETQQTIQNYQEEIRQIRIEITSLNERIQDTKNKISELNKQILEIETEKNIEDIENTSIIRSMDVFDMIGDKLNNPQPGEKILFYLMFLLVIMLEISLFITTEELRERERFNRNHVDFSKYLEILTDTTGDFLKTPLNTNIDISRKTHIPIHECIQYLTFLKNIVFKDIPLIREEKGKVYSNWGKENLLKIAKNRGHFSD
jgi:hypothetical protein